MSYSIWADLHYLFFHMSTSYDRQLILYFFLIISVFALFVISIKKIFCMLYESNEPLIINKDEYNILMNTEFSSMV